jgi:hypothetical protein
MRVNEKIHANIKTIIFALASVLPIHAAHAIDFQTDNPDLKITWNNTFKYSAAYRLKNADPTLSTSTAPGTQGMFVANLNDGDLNFQKKGLVSDRLDWLTEFDIGTRNWGARVSAAAWYDLIYNRPNHNDGSILDATSILSGRPSDEFAPDTRDQHGKQAEVDDAFVYAKGDSGTIRAGRHTLVYGETLFMGANGIAYAQGPTDLVKLLAVPGTPFKEILMPVNQISGTVQVSSNVSVGAYYQLEWRHNRIPGVGSYNSDFNGVSVGVGTMVTGVDMTSCPPTCPPILAVGIDDLKAKNSGQGGIQVKFTPENSGVEYGLYAAQYNDKGPQLYVDVTNPGTFVSPRTWQQVYAEGIKTVGASASGVLLGANVAAEVSIRRDTPLVDDPVFAPGPADSNHPLYGIGNTAHVNLSALYVMPTNSVFEGGVWLAELGWNRATSCTDNCSNVDPNTTRDATAIRAIFAPDYYQVINGLDISIPVGLGYGLHGRSRAVFKFNGGVENGGDFSLGVNGTYQQVWKGGVNYVHYLGKATPFLIPNDATAAIPGGPFPMLSYGQSLADRDNISLYIKRSF